MNSAAKTISREPLDLPFFEPRHRAICDGLDRFVSQGALDGIDHDDVDHACRKLVRALGAAGLLDCAVAAPDGDVTTIDSRSICLSRETLAYADGLADFAFAMQGLGSGAVALAGSPELRNAVLPKVRSGEWLAAFALSEKDAGSDVAAMTCTARADGDSYVLDGEKTWISNGGIADVYTLFARTGEAAEPAVSPRSSSFRMIRDSELQIASTSSLRIHWRHCVWRIAGSRQAVAWGPQVAVSRSRCRRSISSVRRSQPRHSALPGGRSTSRFRTRATGACSAAHCPICN
jgi:alkylation response protein AidB-like acyl-CoA dehydrogenase